jgi:histidine triad (HIT) family protein
MDDCIFCKIVKGEVPSYKIREDKEHLAFLSIFPNTEGVTVVIPKKHYSSYFADVPDEVLAGLISFSKKVAKQIDSKFEDVGRTGLVFEGFGVSHLHTKLFPLHNTKSDKWKEHKSKTNKYFDSYEGLISSHNGLPASGEDLSKTAKKLKK